MGDEFEVKEWRRVDNREDEFAEYKWVYRYQGDSKEHAFEMLELLKREGVGCAQLLWR